MTVDTGRVITCPRRKRKAGDEEQGEKKTSHDNCLLQLRAGKRGRVGDICIMTTRTGWCQSEVSVRVALFARDFRMCFVQSQTGLRMLKGRHVPRLVTAIAIRRRFGEVIRFAVTAATRELLVITFEREARSVMREGLCFLLLMALITAHLSVARVTNSVQRFFCMSDFGRGLFGFRVTGRAAFGMVTGRAINTVSIRMIAMEQCHDGSAAVGRMPDFLFGLHETFEAAAGLGHPRVGWGSFCALLDMANFARRIVAPFLMATQTLTVIGTLQTGLLKIIIGRIGRVTILARGNAADFLKVVAILTAAIHRRHFSMQTM